MTTPKSRVDKIMREIGGVTAQYGVTAWELQFLTSIRLRNVLSPAQEKTLMEIEQKVFPEEDEEEDSGEEDGVQRTDDRFNRGRR